MIAGIERISQAQLDSYAENGYLLVKGLLSREEAGTYRQEAHDLMDRLAVAHNVEATWNSAKQVTQQQTQLLHCHSVEFHSAAFGRLIMDDRFTSIASALMGTPNVQLHHTKLFIKPPEKGSPFPMHQDRPFFPHERDSMIAAIFHFDDAPLEKGCLRMVPGSHKLGHLEHNPEGNYHLPLDQYPLESSVALPAEAGDVLFFSYLTIHGSGVNTSGEARTTLLVQMRDAADRQLEGSGEAGQGLMLRGVVPAEAELGPVIGQ
jgi:ectoine hydroxylase-related dioxygenase (phytanoyl-CoA dioxygenase family)